MSWSDILSKGVVPAVGVVTAVLAAWVNYTASQLKATLDQQQALLNQQKADLEKLTASRNFEKQDQDMTFRIYDAVIESLKTGNSQQQKAASALVIVLAKEPVRTDFLKLFEQSETTARDVKSDVSKVLTDEQQFKSEQAVIKSMAPPTTSVPQPTSGWQGWSVDVFWCEDEGADQSRSAEAVVKSLRDQGATGRIRPRKLPASVNAQDSYSIRGYEVRYDSDEAKKAQELLLLANDAVPGFKFKLRESSQGTYRYLSVFICPAPGL
jgi:hypothetical protein